MILTLLLSYHANAHGRSEARIRPHAAWSALGATDDARRHAYRELVASGISDEERTALSLHTHGNRSPGGANALGSRSKR